MDIAISLILLAVVLTPLCVVIRDLWTTNTRRRERVGAAWPPMSSTSTPSTFPSLSVLEHLEDTMPVCLRRTEWDRPAAWLADPRLPERPVAEQPAH